MTASKALKTAIALVAVAAIVVIAAPVLFPTVAGTSESTTASSSASASSAVGGASGTGSIADGVADAVAGTVSQAKNAAVNGVVDATGIKGAVQDSLVSHAGDIASTTGLATAQVQAIINSLDIESWQVCDLPADAVAQNTVSGNYAGIDASLTLYENPNYVTVEAYGQTLALEVPASAQQSLSLLQYA